jgi:hypothetical protein
MYETLVKRAIPGEEGQGRGLGWHFREVFIHLFDYTRELWSIKYAREFVLT